MTNRGNGLSAPLTPPEVLAKIRRLALKYGYVNTKKVGRGNGALAKISRDTGISIPYLHEIISGRKRKDKGEQLSINSLRLLKGSGKLCRKCSNPALLICLPSRLCVQCELLEKGRQGVIEILEVEPEEVEDG